MSDGPFQGVGGGVVDLTSDGQMRMWVGKCATVGRAVRKRFNEDSRQRLEALQRLRRQEEHHPGKPVDRSERCVERANPARDSPDLANRHVVDDGAKRMQDRHVCWYATRSHRIVHEPRSADQFLGFRNEHHEGRPSHGLRP